MFVSRLAAQRFLDDDAGGARCGFDSRRLDVAQRVGFGAGDDASDGGKDGSAGDGGGVALAGRDRWLAATRDRRKAAAIAGDAGEERPEIPLELLLAPIPSDDPAWAIDCAFETQEAAMALVEAGSRDLDGDGEPDLCQRTFGDFDLNGIVDHQDMALLLLNLGDTDAPFGDLDGDGVVDHRDVEMLIRWIDGEGVGIEMPMPDPRMQAPE